MDAYDLKSAIEGLSKQVSERLKVGDPRVSDYLIERYNFYLGHAKKMNPNNEIIQSLKELSLTGSAMGDFRVGMEKVTYALKELDSQLHYPM